MNDTFNPNTCVTYTFNTQEDNDGKGNPILGISAKSLNEGRLPDRIFEDAGVDFISFREVFNNLDGDDRAGIPIEERFNAGALVQLASIYLLMGYGESPELPKHLYGVHEALIDDVELDTEFDSLTNAAYDNLCSVIFNRTFPEWGQDDELRSDIYCLLTDLIWYMMLALENIVVDLEDVIAVLHEFSYESDVTAYWDEYYLMVKIYDHKPNTIQQYLQKRGLIR